MITKLIRGLGPEWAGRVIEKKRTSDKGQTHTLAREVPLPILLLYQISDVKYDHGPKEGLDSKMDQPTDCC
jgi:hypothetical protein